MGNNNGFVFPPKKTDALKFLKQWPDKEDYIQCHYASQLFNGEYINNATELSSYWELNKRIAHANE